VLTLEYNILKAQLANARMENYSEEMRIARLTQTQRENRITRRQDFEQRTLVCRCRGLLPTLIPKRAYEWLQRYLAFGVEWQVHAEWLAQM
jgi:hypothetical protein